MGVPTLMWSAQAGASQGRRVHRRCPGRCTLPNATTAASLGVFRWYRPALVPCPERMAVATLATVTTPTTRLQRALMQHVGSQRVRNATAGTNPYVVRAGTGLAPPPCTPTLPGAVHASERNNGCQPWGVSMVSTCACACADH